MGGSGWDGAGQSRQASNSSSGSVTHSWMVNGANFVCLSSLDSARAYCAARWAGGLL